MDTEHSPDLATARAQAAQLTQPTEPPSIPPIDHPQTDTGPARALSFCSIRRNPGDPQHVYCTLDPLLLRIILNKHTLRLPFRGARGSKQGLDLRGIRR